MATLKSDLTKIAGRTGEAAKKALLQTGADIVNILHQPGFVPRDTGTLQNSYGAIPISSHEVQVGTAVTYGKFVEYGTEHSPAQPHLTPAFAQAEPTFKARLIEELEKVAGT